MEHIELKRKKFIIGNFENEKSEACLPDVLFNLPNFLFEMIDQEMRNHFINRQSNETKIITEYRQVIIPQASPESNETLSVSPDPIKKIFHIENSEMNLENFQPPIEIKTKYSSKMSGMVNDSNSLGQRFEAINESMHSNWSEKHLSRTLSVPFKASVDGDNLDIKKRKLIPLEKNNLIDPVDLHVWKEAHELEKLAMKGDLNVNEKHETQKSDNPREKKVQKRPVKKIEELKPIKSIISSEEKERRKKLVKMQKMRNLLNYVDPNHLINTNSDNHEKPQKVIKPTYNLEEAQKFMKRKKQEMLQKMKMWEEDLKLQEKRKTNGLKVLRRRQMELRTLNRKRCNTSNHQVNGHGIMINKPNEKQIKKEINSRIENNMEMDTKMKEMVKPLLSIGTQVGDISSDKEDITDLEHIGGYMIPQYPTAKEILLEYAKRNKLSVEEIIGQFTQHADNIKLYLSKGTNKNPQSEFRSSLSVGNRLIGIKNMSQLLENKIHQTSFIIKTSEAISERTSSELNQQSTLVHEMKTAHNFEKLKNRLVENMENENILGKNHSIKSETPASLADEFDAILTDLQVDPFNIFKIFAKKQYELRPGMENKLIKSNDFDISQCNSREKVDKNNLDFTHETCHISWKYDDGFDEQIKKCHQLNESFKHGYTSAEKKHEIHLPDGNDVKTFYLDGFISNDAEMTNEKDELMENSLCTKVINDTCPSEKNSSSFSGSMQETALDESILDIAKSSIDDHPFLSESYLDQLIWKDEFSQFKMSPDDLELRLMTEMNLMEILDSSIIQLNGIESSKVISEIKQENLALNHIFKSQEIIHNAHTDEVLKRLNEGFTSHQHQREELLKLQQQLQNQQLKKKAIIKEYQQPFRYGHGDHTLKETLSEIHQAQQEIIKYVQENMQRQGRQHDCQDILGIQPVQSMHEGLNQDIVEPSNYHNDNILVTSLAGVIELQKEAALNLAKMTDVMVHNQNEFSSKINYHPNHLNIPEMEKNNLVLNVSAKHKIEDHRFPMKSHIKKVLDSRTETTKNKNSFMAEESHNSYSYTLSSSVDSCTPIIESKISDSRENNKNVEIENSIGNAKNDDSLIIDEVSRTYSSTDTMHSYGGDNGTDAGTGNGKCWDAFSLAMIQIQLKEDLSLQQHKLLLLLAKNRSLEKTHKIELANMGRNCQNIDDDEEMHKIMKRKMKMVLAHKIEKAELKRLINGARTSIDACKMMTNEVVSLQRWISTREVQGQEIKDLSLNLSSTDNIVIVNENKVRNVGPKNKNFDTETVRDLGAPLYESGTNYFNNIFEKFSKKPLTSHFSQLAIHANTSSPKSHDSKAFKKPSKERVKETRLEKEELVVHDDSVKSSQNEEGIRKINKQKSIIKHKTVGKNKIKKETDVYDNIKKTIIDHEVQTNITGVIKKLDFDPQNEIESSIYEKTSAVIKSNLKRNSNPKELSESSDIYSVNSFFTTELEDKDSDYKIKENIAINEESHLLRDSHSTSISEEILTGTSLSSFQMLDHNPVFTNSITDQGGFISNQTKNYKQKK